MKRLIALGVTSMIAGCLAWAWWSTPGPPQVDPTGAEPAVLAAIEEARSAVRRQPRSAATWGHLGLVLRVHRFDRESDMCLARAERLDANNPRWPYQRGLILLPRDVDASLPFLTRAVELCDRFDKSNHAPRLVLGEVYLQRGQIEEAEKHFRIVLDRDPDNPRAHYDLGLAAYARDDFEASAGSLAKTLDNPFTRKRSLARLGELYLRLGNAEGAADFGRRADQLPADRLWPDPYIQEYLDVEVGRQSRFTTVEALGEQGQADDVLRMIRQMAKEYPDERSFTALGISLAKVGDFAAAELTLRDALRLAPDKVQAHYFLGVSLYFQAERLRQEGKLAEATAKYRQAAEATWKATQLKPDHAYAHLYHGLSLNQLDQRAQAIVELETALRCRPEFVDFHLHLGELLADAGRQDDARKHLENALKLAPPQDSRPRQALDKLNR